MLSQFSWDTWHVGRLPSEDIFVVSKKVGEREFLFYREVGADGCHFGGITGAQVDLLDIGFFWCARMLGFLAGISSSSGLSSTTIAAISFLPLVACALAAI